MKPHVICAHETWLKSQWYFVTQDYTLNSNDWEKGKGGEVAKFVQNGTKDSLSGRGKEERINSNQNMERKSQFNNNQLL